MENSKDKNIVEDENEIDINNDTNENLIVKIYYYIKQFKFYLTPIFLSVYAIIYGIQFVFRTREAYRTSELYIALSKFMDLQIYGVFLLVSGFCIGISLFLNKYIGRPFLIVGSFISFVLFFIYAVISLDSAGMQSTMIIRIVFSFVNLFLAIFTFLEMKVENIIDVRK
ncbi:hypothetical protein CPT_Machias_049 [Staphylococcus phage Machias]|nr:hypothetical protein CPT_Machias_049 [Staphylococcus phage Machias]